RKLLDDLDIGSEAGAGEGPLEEIVTEQGALGHATVERRFEGIYVVNAFAGIGAFAEEILVHVGYGGSVRIDAARAGEDALEQRPFAADRQRWRNARLQYPISFDDAPGDGIEPRVIERVRHLADQPAGGFPRHPG